MRTAVPPLRIELHCHTVHSHDGLMTFESLLSSAKKNGLGAVAITDHDTMDGALDFCQRAEAARGEIQLIAGEERTLSDGSHLIGLFLRHPIQSFELPCVVREIEEQGGFCLIPHPFRRKDGLLRNGLQPLSHFEGRVAGFELFSAKCSFEENQKAAELLSHSTLGPFGGSDAHYESDLGECVNVIEQKGDLRSSIQQMLERRTPLQILGKPQRAGDKERRYAPLYYRVKRFVRMPKLLLPAAKQCYRRYRNFKYGVGPKTLREVYSHA